ncbi:hypothetical protein GCM10010495_76740 [Kitasatospora herbaricolor]|uniref:hypothetical protein n=1 Tax=Kitasatospora herbaricolor TaxID=68217 RepID=UPI00174A2639|nr:hypothetical protein [Kitasatospora herbaricolor]MDQ0305511.1 hypothetical protein [Kitasatospora herbaricolor]GGV47687.1 hypothetical protein GCM10010495_76740 [Kitasatospora herbaricolor]
MTVNPERLVSPELLLVLAAGQGWDSVLWRELMELVRSRGASDGVLAVASVEAFEGFESSPTPRSAELLSEVLQSRAMSDPGFQEGLSGWADAFGDLPSRPVNMISGGTFHGSVVQGSAVVGIVHVFTSDPADGG